MKTIFSLLTTCYLTVTSFACGGYGNYFAVLSVHSVFPCDLSIVIDQAYYTSVGSNFDLSDLEPGSHKLTISRKTSNKCGTSINKILYNGFVDIPSNNRLTVTIGKNDCVELSTRKLLSPTVTSYPAGCCGGDNAGTFALFKQKLDDETFDSKKLAMSKQFVSANGIAASEVLAIMNSMTFEANRLAIAKYAYEFCYDQGNYFLVNDGFSFNSSTYELNNYIGI